MLPDQQRGTIINFNTERFFGFLRADDGSEYFYHGRDIKCDELNVNERVVFKLRDSRRHEGKREAYDVRIAQVEA